MADLWLVIREGSEEGSEHEVDGELTVGRDEDAELSIDDASVSRLHARFSAGGAGITVEDLGSSNGTFVNDRRISGAAHISDGDLVQVGDTVFEVQGTDSATQLMGADETQPIRQVDVSTAQHARPTAPPPPREQLPRAAPSPVARQPDPMEDGNLPALFAAFLGPLSIFLVILSAGGAFFVSLAAGIGAVVLGSIGKRKVDKGESDRHRGWAVFGQVTGIIGTVLSVLALILFFIVTAFLDTTSDSLKGLINSVRDEIQKKNIPDVQVPTTGN